MLPLELLFDQSLLTHSLRKFAEKRMLPVHIYSEDGFNFLEDAELDNQLVSALISKNPLISESSMAVIPDAIFLENRSSKKESFRTNVNFRKSTKPTVFFVDDMSPSALQESNSAEVEINLKRILAHLPEAAFFMMGAQKPSIVLQALAVLMMLGFSKIRVIDSLNLDLTKNPHDTDNINLDLQFLSSLLRFFPDVSIDVKENKSDRYVSVRSAIVHTERTVQFDNINKVSATHQQKLLVLLADLEAEKQKAEILTQQVKEHKSEISALKASYSFRIGKAILQPMRKVRELLHDLPRSSDNANQETLQITDSRCKNLAREIDILIVCHEVSSMTGVHRPIMLYMKEMEQRGTKVGLLDLSHWDKSRVADKIIPSAPVTIINSIAAIQWKSIRSFLGKNPANTWIYLHETAWTIEKFKFTNPEDFSFLEKCAPTLSMLAVSDAQKNLMKSRFGAKRIDVIRNVTPNANMNFKNVRSYDEKMFPPSIIMVGTIQARKGAELFSLVADLAAEKKRPWKFCWIGHATNDDLYLSEQVEWVGVRKGDDLLEEYRKSSLFFLPSRDDPFPLSVIEAMSFGIKLVTYNKVGSAEIMGGLDGCITFSEYSAASAFQAIDHAMNEDADQQEIFERARPYADPSNFAEVLNKSIGFEGG